MLHLPSLPDCVAASWPSHAAPSTVPGGCLWTLGLDSTSCCNLHCTFFGSLYCFSPSVCPAASSFDLDLVTLPQMSTVELKACLGFVPSRTSICLTRSGVVTRLIQGHFVFSRLLQETSHMAGQARILTPVSASWERSKPTCSQAQKLVHVHYRISCLAANSFDLDLLALPKMSTVELKDCFGFVPARTRDCLARNGVALALFRSFQALQVKLGS